MTRPLPTLPPRRRLAALPTPLDAMPRLSEALGLELSVKRDDLTGSHLGGNKVRKLEFLLADALAAGATHVITCGGIQSNHARATALAARPLGLTPVLLLRTPHGDAADLPSPPSGNVLLDRIAGARIVTCSPADYRERRGALMAELARAIAADGGSAYLVPEGGSNALGSLGYVAAAWELAAQLEAQSGGPPDAVVVATGSGGTLAGLAAGFEAMGAPTRVFGVAVCDDRAYFRAIVDRIAADLVRDHAFPPLGPARYEVLEGFQGRGYAQTTPEELRFLVEVAQADGLVLDPVYTNKALIGLVESARRAPGMFGRRVVFIHTGGIFGLFPQAAELATVV
ncbi:MAG: D-cysteine desulfhydrase family protein [Myxococcota bacterium]